jgi:hypothetical protein
VHVQKYEYLLACFTGTKVRILGLMYRRRGRKVHIDAERSFVGRVSGKLVWVCGCVCVCVSSDSYNIWLVTVTQIN